MKRVTFFETLPSEVIGNLNMCARPTYASYVDKGMKIIGVKLSVFIYKKVLV